MAFSLMRARILQAIKKDEPINIVQLAKKLKISGGTSIYRYVRELEERGLIKTYKELKKRGQPTMLITTEKAKPLLDGELKALEKISSYFK